MLDQHISAVTPTHRHPDHDGGLAQQLSQQMVDGLNHLNPRDTLPMAQNQSLQLPLGNNNQVRQISLATSYPQALARPHHNSPPLRLLSPPSLGMATCSTTASTIYQLCHPLSLQERTCPMTATHPVEAEDIALHHNPVGARTTKVRFIN